MRCLSQFSDGLVLREVRVKNAPFLRPMESIVFSRGIGSEDTGAAQVATDLVGNTAEDGIALDLPVPGARNHRGGQAANAG